MTVSRMTIAILIWVACVPTIKAAPVFIGFEGFAPSGQVVNVNPLSPYVESGFRFSPTTSQSAVFDSLNSAGMPGNATDWFGFAELNAVTLAPADSLKMFNLASLLIGRSRIALGAPTNLTMTGSVAGGGALSAVFNGLTTAATVTLNWRHLVSVKFDASNDMGIDDLVVQLVPEPSALAIAATALLAAQTASTRRRRRWRWPRRRSSAASSRVAATHLSRQV